MDLITTKELLDTEKMKLLDGTVFNISVYSHGNNKEYLAHVVAVLRVIKQKGPVTKCRKLGKAVVRLFGTLKNLQKAAGS